MFETNTQNNSALISLSRAAQLTGYHQDYLGQLCRVGKLSATKVGRNWFTSSEALDRLSTAGEMASEMTSEMPSDIEAEAETIEIETAPQPEIVQNILVSQVEGMPISIRTLAKPVRNTNHLQNILTTIRIESLQQEVFELRQMLGRLMVEVGSHAKMLQSRQSVSHERADSLKHQYVSNFNFDAPYSRLNIIKHEDPQVVTQSFKEPIYIESENRNQYPIVAWITATAVMVALALLGSTMIAGQFFGSTETQVSTIYHHQQLLDVGPEESPLEPTVAGDTLPTPLNGDLQNNMIQ